jgi:heme/copper-type cytochrome/quinol oxidase subunit 1
MLTAILLSIAALSLIGFITITILTYNFIVSWFRKREKIKNADKDNIAFTIQEKMQNKQYKTVQGIFNKRTNEVVNAQEIRSDKVDKKMEENHRGNKLVVYE